MPPLYPLTFHPIFKRYIWGGRRLGTVLGKPIGPGGDYAESWEIADHQHGQSVVANGPLAGTTLHELVESRGIELLGEHSERHGGRSLQRRFPLIFKYLDCQRNLSVQVHPSDAAAAHLDPPDLGKTEAWVVIEASPGSRIYAGLKPGCDRPMLEAGVREGRVEDCLHSFEPTAGQCVFIPAGTVHALGGGLLIAEIQQSSDTTYRLFDWNRLGPGGRPRPLHIEEALDAIDYSAHQVAPQLPQGTNVPHIQRLVACDKFILDRWRLTEPQSLGADGRCHIVSVLEGEVSLDEAEGRRLMRGQTVLLPASLAAVSITPHDRAVFLDMYLP